ncbi:cyclin-F isoform X2 [Pristis pectinata]|uniref:cyclin-F isoform X2 n=1 Tax=Pristis pectinata TaxID=685728 RepID=UPI00223D35C6|nr:cyclin-F isoform X2 [Pristis pectinata]XP_051878515.1 cyclin-F isoform X2 [Pristis pectinata]
MEHKTIGEARGHLALCACSTVRPVVSDVFHCNCAKCVSLPAIQKVKKSTPALTLLSLPADVLLYVLECLPAQDILRFRAVNGGILKVATQVDRVVKETCGMLAFIEFKSCKVHPLFKALVDNHSSVWAHANFQEIWPSPVNRWLFERAAESGNFEAAVKLGIAYLYNEGLSVSDEGRAEVNGLKASHFFSLAESLNVDASPFVWLFIRPPWSLTGSCCKAVVYDSLKNECQLQSAKAASLTYCLAKVLSLFEDEEKQKQAISMFEESSCHGCLPSSYHLWERNHKEAVADPGRFLQSLRKLRDYATKGCWEAQLTLAKACGSGSLLGLKSKPKDLVAQIFQSSCPSFKQKMFKVQKGMNDTMRYILIDWLVEVTSMKDFSSLCLHVTVANVDRYLMLRSVPRGRLQLLGIACMVICTRFISKEILTIREAVWLTDNTYKYEDLVRMMGEIISALRGKIKTPTILDYAEVLLAISPLERHTVHLFNYICELSLLYTDISVYSPSMTAAAALLLARVLHKQALPWSSQLTESTGFTLESLIPCVITLHKKCFHNEVPRDYRQVSLTAVKQRFEDERHQQISKEKVMDYNELCSLLGIKEESGPSPPSVHTVPEIQTFLTSPSGNKTKRRREDSFREDRGNFVATPIVELSNHEDTFLGDFVDLSLDLSCTGYEGDQESEEEKHVDITDAAGVEDAAAASGNCEATDEESDDSLLDDQLLPGSQRSAAPCAFRELQGELSSGYSSVTSESSSSSDTRQPLPSTSRLSPTVDRMNPTPSSFSTESWHLLHESEPEGHGNWSPPSRRRPIKRKNGAEHNKGDSNLGLRV